MADNASLIIPCPECKTEMDVSSLTPFSMVSCPSCQHAFRVRTRLGQYEIQDLIGEGGMSQVFAAQDVTLGRTVALKILHQQLSQDKKLTAMFEREARLTASISHPNVVRVYTVGEEHGYFYIAMELLDAVSIEDRIEKGAIPEQEVLRVAADVVSGLKAAYNNQLIHRDIKPGNILQTQDGTAKLVDFGLAVAQGGADENEDMWATPFYVPPEKLVRHPDTYLGDIYALGATCYHAIAGIPPFDANTGSLEELIRIKATELDLSAVAPHVSEPTVRLIENMMAYEPNDRPVSYDKLLERIEFCQGKQSVQKNSRVMPVKDPAKSKLLLFVGVGALILCVLGGALVMMLNGGKNEELTTAPKEEVIAVDENLTKKFRQASRLLGNSDASEASALYSELSETEDFPQPDRAWSAFLNGMSALVGEEDKEILNERLVSLSKQTEVPPKYQKFFKRMQTVMKDASPIPRSEFNVKKDSFEMVGLLVAGLKNWEQDEFDEAIQFFDEFAQKTAPKKEFWINNLKPIATQFIDEYTKVQGLPQPKREMSKDELTEILQITDTIGATVKTKKMSEKVSIVRRQAELIKSLDLQLSSATTGSSVWTDSENADLESIQTVVSKISTNTGSVAQLRELDLSTDKGVELRDLLVDGYLTAAKVFPMMIKQFNEIGFEGKIVRKKGKSVQGKVTGATAEELSVDLGFGSNQIAISEFPPKWLFETSLDLLPEPSLGSINDWQTAFWFATVKKQKQAASIGDRIEAYDPDFVAVRKMLEKIEF